MKPLFILFYFSVAPFAHAIDVGDGSDGACTEASFLVGKRTYQCTTLTISANVNLFKGQGGSSIVIKVQNNVTIDPGVTIDIGGNDGLDGTTAAVNGGAGGPGGGSGGNSRLGLDGLSGSGSGAGTAGKFVANLGVRSYGGGGGGASYKTISGTTASDGDDGGGGGTVPGTAGANGSVYASEATFDTTFAGGSGGAAGGGADNGGTIVSGSSGGGGGGAIRIISGGNIVIDGQITSKGGNGGGVAGTISSGAGGAASGGAIWLQAAGTLTVSASGTLTALGGTGGTNDSGVSGLGGDGGDGRIRLDDADGVITNNGTVTPAPFSASFSPTTAGTSSVTARQYSSSISCAKVSEEFNQNHLINLVFGFLIAGTLHLISSKRKA